MNSVFSYWRHTILKQTGKQYPQPDSSGTTQWGVPIVSSSRYGCPGSVHSVHGDWALSSSFPSGGEQNSIHLSGLLNTPKPPKIEDNQTPLESHKFTNIAARNLSHGQATVERPCFLPRLPHSRPDHQFDISLHAQASILLLMMRPAAIIRPSSGTLAVLCFGVLAAC
jgi:hypothetical protein